MVCSGLYLEWAGCKTIAQEEVDRLDTTLFFWGCLELIVVTERKTVLDVIPEIGLDRLTLLNK